MIKKLAKSLFLITGFFALMSASNPVKAANITGEAYSVSAVTEADSVKTVKDDSYGSLFTSVDLATSHFTWGAELGSSIDMTGHDMSTLDADVVIGYKNKWIRTVGFGAGIHRAFGTGDNFIPLYAVFRTSFTSRPSNFFMSVKIGYSFNSIQDSPTFGDTCASIGAGINLAMSHRFSSHIILSIQQRHFTKRHSDKYKLNIDNIYLVGLSFGVNF